MAIITRSAEGARETVRQKRERDQELLVWPDLVFVEFIASVLFTITFVILSVFVNAPLLNQANSNITPNPSKAPWYLMNLQELLLHMEAGLAGVIVPTIALIVLAAIPYIDRSNDGQGVWFGTKNAVKIATSSPSCSRRFYITACILWDDGAHVRVYEQFPVAVGAREEGDEWNWPGNVNPFREDGATDAGSTGPKGRSTRSGSSCSSRTASPSARRGPGACPCPSSPGRGRMTAALIGRKTSPMCRSL